LFLHDLIFFLQICEQQSVFKVFGLLG
jgi:hypothetical protein